jgi:hypothetical protein
LFLQCTVGHAGDLKQVRIVYVNFHMESLVDLDCEAFDSLQGSKAIIIRDSAALNRLSVLIDKLEIDSTDGPAIDTRGKAYLEFKSGSHRILCFSPAKMCLDGFAMVFRRDLLKYIERLIRLHDRDFENPYGK